MKELSYKISIGGLSLKATCFEDGLGTVRREALGEMFDNLSSIHRHAEYEIFFVCDGEMELVCKEGNRHFSNSAVILPPDFDHYTVIDATRLFVIYMTVDGIDGTAAEAVAERLSRGVVSAEIGEDARFYLERLSAAKSSFDRPHLMYLLFSNLLGSLDPRINGSNVEEGTMGKYAFAIEGYIEDHYYEKMRLCDLAAHIHLCEKQVMRVIKREYGCSFSDCVNQKRMSVAIMMLMHTDLPIFEIAHRVGFENDNYFFRVFKKKYGDTPAKYRSKHKSRLE